MSRTSLFLPLSLSLLLGACKTPSTKIDVQELEQAAKTDEKRGQAATKIDPLPVELPADLLPADVPVVLEANDPAVLLPLFDGLWQIPELDSGRRELADMLGADLTKADEWAKIGLDVHGRAGVALLEPNSFAIAVWIGVGDEQLFSQSLMRLAERTGQAENFARSELGYARVYRFARDLHVVVREGVAMFVFVDNPDRAPRDYPATFATIDPRDGLARTPNFAWARGLGRVGDDGILFVAPAPLLQAWDTEQKQNDYGVTWAEDQLAEARRNGADAATITELERRIEEEREWQREREREQAAARDAMRELFGPLRAFSVTGDVERTSISARANLLLPEGGLLRELFVPLQSQSPLPNMLDEPPLLLLDGQVDVQKALRLADLLARADDESIDELDRELAQLLGFSFLKSVIPLFDGRVGFAITQTRELDPKKLDKLEQTLGVAAHAGLKDPDGTRKLLDDLARNPLAKGVFTRGKKGGYELEIPEWKTVHIDVIGERLVMSSDRALLGRVRDAKPGKQAALITGDHVLIGPSPTPALRFYQRWTLYSLIDGVSHYEQTVDSYVYDLDAHPTLTREQAAKVPRGKPTKQKLAELEKVLAEINTINRRRQERDFLSSYEQVSELGQVGMEVATTTDGLAIDARWKLAGQRSFLEIVVGGLMLRDMSNQDDWAAQEQLYIRASELSTEIRQLRAQELDAAAAKLQLNK